MSRASYTYLDESDWRARIAGAERLCCSCSLCPRGCGVDRPAGGKGFCGAGAGMRISSIFPHHGEEPPISGAGGSGTVFFSHCTLRCVFCQNYQISHQGEGAEYTVEELARRMVWLQECGCCNVNLVTPTHYLPWILRALHAASAQGLGIPVVYNCGEYEREEVLRLLDGIVDIYLPDMKYGDNRAAGRLSGADDYVEVNRRAIREMFRQVGPLNCDSSGMALRGLLIRHLVLPNGHGGSGKVVEFLAGHFDPDDIAVSVMAQYAPRYRAGEHPEIARRISREEYERARAWFEDAGFGGYYQDAPRMDESFLIDFTRRKFERLGGESS